jgi:hypothetical protein
MPAKISPTQKGQERLDQMYQILAEDDTKKWTSATLRKEYIKRYEEDPGYRRPVQVMDRWNSESINQRKKIVKSYIPKAAPVPTTKPVVESNRTGIPARPVSLRCPTGTKPVEAAKVGSVIPGSPPEYQFPGQVTKDGKPDMRDKANKEAFSRKPDEPDDRRERPEMQVVEAPPEPPTKDEFAESTSLPENWGDEVLNSVTQIIEAINGIGGFKRARKMLKRYKKMSVETKNLLAVANEIGVDKFLKFITMWETN